MVERFILNRCGRRLGAVAEREVRATDFVTEFVRFRRNVLAVILLMEAMRLVKMIENSTDRYKIRERTKGVWLVSLGEIERRTERNKLFGSLARNWMTWIGTTLDAAQSSRHAWW